MSEQWRVELSSAARRDLRRLPSKVATAVVEFVTSVLADKPVRLSKPLHNEFSGYRSARRGDYRVLIRIDESARTVLGSITARTCTARRNGHSDLLA